MIVIILRITGYHENVIVITHEEKMIWSDKVFAISEKGKI